jgi:hypothetical protein
MPVLFFLLATLAVAPARSAAEYEEATFGDWWVACNRERTCTAFGLNPGGASGFVRVERDGGPRDSPEVILATPTPRYSRKAVRVDLSIQGGRRMQPLRLRGELDPKLSFHAFNYYYMHVKEPSARGLLLNALVSGERLVMQPAQGEPGQVSLKGAAAALRWMDERQKRVGTVTALVARGPRPASATPPPPARRTVRAAKPAPQTRLPKELPPGLARRPEFTCFSGEPELTIHRLGPGRILWGASCGGLYNVPTQLYIADEQGRGLKPLVLWPEDPGREGQNIITTGGFDPATMTLDEFVRGRGLGDCGAANEWVWDGERFQLTSRLLSGPCAGVPVTYWAVVLSRDVRR